MLSRASLRTPCDERRAAGGRRLGPGSRGADLDGLGKADGVAEDVGAGQAADRAAVRRRLLLQRQARRGGGGGGGGRGGVRGLRFQGSP